MENSDQPFTSKFRITEKITTVCIVNPQKPAHKRTKNHIIFPVTDDDILDEHISSGHKYKINLVVQHLLSRSNQLITSARCGNVNSYTDSSDHGSNISEITTNLVLFCDGKSRVTSEALNNP